MAAASRAAADPSKRVVAAASCAMRVYLASSVADGTKDLQRTGPRRIAAVSSRVCRTIARRQSKAVRPLASTASGSAPASNRTGTACNVAQCKIVSPARKRSLTLAPANTRASRTACDLAHARR